MSSQLDSNSLNLNEVTLSISSGVMYVRFSVDVYSPVKTYQVGDYCYINQSGTNRYYVCKKDTPSPAGTFDESYWKER